MRNRIAAMMMAAVTVVAVGCAHTQESKTDTEGSRTAVAQPDNDAAAKPQGQSCSSDNDCKSDALCIRNVCTPISVGLAECQSIRVHFEFNKSTVEDQDQDALNRIGRCLRAEQSLRVSIEGNADERGTEEYNLSLGQQRANGVERYLERLGVNPQQLKTVTYGYEKPVCTEHNEECWSKNRRAAVKTKP